MTSQCVIFVCLPELRALSHFGSHSQACLSSFERHAKKRSLSHDALGAFWILKCLPSPTGMKSQCVLYPVESQSHAMTRPDTSSRFVCSPWPVRKRFGPREA